MNYKKQCLLILTAFSCVILIFYMYRTQKDAFVKNFSHFKLPNLKNYEFKKSPEIVIAVVACNQRLPETLNMIKSALLFHQDNVARLKFVVVAETDLMEGFREKLDDWRTLLNDSFDFEVLPLTFPEANRDEWRNLFKPCAAQRLFLPSMLKHIDSVLYMDTDTLFLSPVSEIWKYFKQFNSSQLAALSPEHEDPNVGWYNRFAKHPYYGPLGVNSGVMLMNLTRMREFDWESQILPIYKDYRLKITWGDQDLINILFFFHPDKLFVFNCEWNYRPDHCMYMSVCKAPSGIKIVHGNRGYFHADKQPAFTAIYNTVEEFRLGETQRQFLLAMESALSDSVVTQSNCGKVKDKFLYKARQLFMDVNYMYE